MSLLPTPEATPAAGHLQPGQVLPWCAPLSGALTLEQAVGARDGRRFWRARAADAEAFTVVEGGVAPAVMQSIPDRRVLRPLGQVQGPAGPLPVYPRPAAISVTEWLSDAGQPPEARDVLRFGMALCDVLEGIHGAGRCVFSLDPDQVLRTPTLDALLAGLQDLPAPGTAPTLVHTATAAPEVLHRLAPLCGLPSDVYAVAAVIHALLARHALWRPPTGLSTVLTHQYAPRTWRPELPLGIWPRLAPALDPDPARRMPHLGALRSALERAHKAVVARAAPLQPVTLDGWADSHIGVGKARRGGDQQDRLFCGLGAGATLALGAVADGVSHATLGDGGAAAEHTAGAVRVLFDRVSQGTGMGTDPVSLQKRAEAMDSVGTLGTQAIAADANTRGRLNGDPSGVMASTLVMALVEGGVISLLNLGDSRAYLYDGEVCEGLTIDHDRRTEAVRAGMDPYQAQSLEAGGALTRAMGRVTVGPDGTLHPNASPVDVFHYPMLPTDRIVLCSDGLPDYALPLGRTLLAPTAVEQVVAEQLRKHDDAAAAAHALIGVANQNGGHDNIAVVVLQAVRPS